jgi:hypothetical protein
MNSEAFLLAYGQRVALLNAAHHTEATEAMRGIDLDGRDIPALTSRALIAAFTTSRGWIPERGL